MTVQPRSHSVTLFASGSNGRGQLARDSREDSRYFSPCIFSSPASRISSLPPSAGISQLVSGANHTIVALHHHGTPGVSLWGCGDNSRGQLGPGNASALVFHPLEIISLRPEFAEYYPRLIAAAWETSFVVLSSDYSGKGDLVLSVGADDWGDLGAEPSETGLQVMKFDHLVDPDGQPLDASTLHVKAVVAGPHHVVLHLQTGGQPRLTQDFLVGWGASRHGQLGPKRCASSKSLACTPLPQIIEICPPASQIFNIALGNQHTVLQISSGGLFGFGSDRKGQLRDLQTLKSVVEVACTWNGTYVLANGVGLLSTGSHERGQLGRSVNRDALDLVQFPDLDVHTRVKRIACGSEHVLCKVGEDEVWAWGWNEHGNLGIGSTNDVTVPTRIWPPEDEHQLSRVHGSVHGIWAGCGTSWIALEHNPPLS